MEAQEHLLRLVETTVEQGLRSVEGDLLRRVEEDVCSLVTKERRAQQEALAEVMASVAALRRDLVCELGAARAEQSQALEKAAAAIKFEAVAAVRTEETEVRAQLKQYAEQLLGDLDLRSLLPTLLEEERSQQHAEVEALRTRLQAVEASCSGGAAGTEGIAGPGDATAVEETLTMLCARLEAVSREVAARAPPSAGLAVAEAEVASMLARLEAVEAACRSEVASRSVLSTEQEMAVSAGELASLSRRLLALERQAPGMIQAEAGGELKEAAAQAVSNAAAEASSADLKDGAASVAEQELAERLQSLEQDRGPGAVNAALGCGLARCIGEMNTELRTELAEGLETQRSELGRIREELDRLRGDLQHEVKAEATARACATEACLGEIMSSLEAKLKSAVMEVEARVSRVEASPDFGPRVTALESEVKRINSCMEHITSRTSSSEASLKAQMSSLTPLNSGTSSQRRPGSPLTSGRSPPVAALDGGTRAPRVSDPGAPAPVSIHCLPSGGTAGSPSDLTSPGSQGSLPKTPSEATVVGNSGRRRVVEVPVLEMPATQSLPPEASLQAVPIVPMDQMSAKGHHRNSRSPLPRARSPAQQTRSPLPWPQQPEPDGPLCSGGSSTDRERFLTEISTLRRENSSLREEVMESREDALRQLRSNAERALQEQQVRGSASKGKAAEGPVVAALGLGGAAALPLQALPRGGSPMPASKVRVVNMGTGHSATAPPGSGAVAPPLSPPVMAGTSLRRLNAESVGSRRSGAHPVPDRA